jgi:hypothetical protein
MQRLPRPALSALRKSRPRPPPSWKRAATTAQQAAAAGSQEPLRQRRQRQPARLVGRRLAGRQMQQGSKAARHPVWATAKHTLMQRMMKMGRCPRQISHQLQVGCAVRMLCAMATAARLPRCRFNHVLWPRKGACVRAVVYALGSLPDALAALCLQPPRAVHRKC